MCLNMGPDCNFWKDSVCVQLFPQSKPPSVNRQPSPDVSLLCFNCCFFPRDCSQETFLEKPQGIDFLYALGQQTACVLLAAAVLQPLGTKGGTASQEEEDGSRIGGETRQEKNTKTTPGWETRQQGDGGGWGMAASPSLLPPTQPRSTVSFPPFLLATYRIVTTASPLTASKMPGPREGTASVLVSDESHLAGEKKQAIWKSLWDLSNWNQWLPSVLFIVKNNIIATWKDISYKGKKDYSWSYHPNTTTVFFFQVLFSFLATW